MFRQRFKKPLQGSIPIKHRINSESLPVRSIEHIKERIGRRSPARRIKQNQIVFLLNLWKSLKKVATSKLNGIDAKVVKLVFLCRCNRLSGYIRPSNGYSTHSF